MQQVLPSQIINFIASSGIALFPFVPGPIQALGGSGLPLRNSDYFVRSKEIHFMQLLLYFEASTNILYAQSSEFKKAANIIIQLDNWKDISKQKLFTRKFASFCL